MQAVEVESERANVHSHAEKDTTRIVARAVAFIERNGGVWERFVAQAVADAAAHRRISVQHFAEEVRATERVDSEGGDGWKVNNDYCAVFARLLVREHPECKPCICLRKSRFDYLLRGDANGGV